MCVERLGGREGSGYFRRKVVRNNDSQRIVQKSPDASNVVIFRKIINAITTADNRTKIHLAVFAIGQQRAMKKAPIKPSPPKKNLGKPATDPG